MPNADVEIKAVYKAKTFTITVSAEPSEGGVVTVEGTYLEDIPASSGTYEMNTPVSITATANEGYEFVKWTENGIDIDAIQNFGFDVTKNRNLVAVFAPKTTASKTLRSIAVTTPPNKTDYIPGESFESIGMVVTATYSDDSATPVTGYTVTDGTDLTVGKTSVTISYTEDGVTKTTTQAITVEYDVLLFADNNDGIAEKTVQTEGGVFTFPAADTLTAPAGKKFSHWTVRDTEYNPGDTLTITENAIFVFANWKDICTVTIGDVTVEGTKDEEINAVGVKLTFSVGSYIFANVQAGTDVSGWFTNLPAGLKAKVDYKNANYIVVTISGTPTAISSDTIAVTVPGSALVDSESITAETNTNAKYAITAGSNEYNITVTGGTASVGAGTAVTKATAGTVITLTVDESAIPAGKVFDKWEVVSGGVTVADGKFTMPANAVEIRATYKDAPVIPTEYDITVTGGTASANKAIAGTEITLTVDESAIPAGKVFDKWEVVSGGVTITDGKFTMPANAVEIRATYKDAPVVPTEYNITVTGGTASANKAVAGTEITLTVDESAIPAGKVFDKWEVVSGGVTITDGKFTMPANAVEINATYKDAPVSHTCDIKPVAKDEPSCTEGGKEAYYKCEGCGKFYEDALGAKEITDLANWGNLPKLGHTESDWKSDKDNHWKECTVTACGVIIEDSKAAHKDDNKDGKCDVCEYNVGIPTTPDDDKPNDNPQTGDNSNMFLWIALLFISGAGVVATTVFGKKKFSVK